MRLWLGTVLVWGLLLGLGSPAQALVIDDFSAGAFNLTDTGAGRTSTQPCGSFCLGGTREVFLQGVVGGAPATAQLAAPPGEMQTGGDGSFSFTVTVDTSLEPVDLTMGGTATQIQVSFTAFQPGGTDVSLTLTDSTGTSQTVSNPDFFNPDIFNPLSAFAPVDLQSVTQVQVSVQAPAAGGDHHITLIQVPEPGPSTATPFSLPGITTTAGPPFPSPVLPIAVFRPEPDDEVLVMDIEFSITDATNAAGPVAANVVGQILPDDGRLFLTTSFPGGLTSPEIASQALYPDLKTYVIEHDWLQNTFGDPVTHFFDVTADIAVEGGTVRLALFGQTGLNQPISISSFALAGEDSTLLTVGLTGPVDGTIPALNMTLGGEFTPTPAVPVFAPHDLAPLLLAGLVILGAWVLVTRVRRRGAGAATARRSLAS